MRRLSNSQDSKHLKVSNVRTMKMNDDVLAVAVSPDAKYIAVALLDNTVKVRLTCHIIFLSLHFTLMGYFLFKNLPLLLPDVSSSDADSESSRAVGY